MPRLKNVACLIAWCSLALVSTGCRSTLSTQYGLSEGYDARYSPASVSLFRNLCNAKGRSTLVVRSFSPRAMTRLQAIVWSPDSFEPHKPETLAWIDRWLSSGERTLVYVGRDFSPTADYWSQSADELAVNNKSPNDLLFAKEQQATEILNLDRMRSRVRTKVVTPWCWFDHSPGREERVTALQGPWSESVDASKSRLFVRSFPAPYLAESLVALQTEMDWEPKDAKATPAIPVKPNISTGFERQWVDSDTDMLQIVKPLTPQGLPEMENLLTTTEDVPLITELTSGRWGTSRVIVVANSSMLSNIALINSENFIIAKMLIDELPQKNIGFLTGSSDPPVRKDDYATQQKGFEMLTMWPLNVISLHAVFLGMLVLLAAFPIFGRAKQLPSKSTREFAQHIEAAGGLLARSQDRSYALATISEYFRVVRKEPTSPWANVDPMQQQEPQSPFEKTGDGS